MVFVTGIGIISAIGKNASETLSSLLESRTGIGKINHLQTIHKDNYVAGEVNYSLQELENLAGLKNSNYNRTTLLSLLATQEALENAGVKDITVHRTGFISASSVGGMCHSELLYKDFLEHKPYTNFIDTHYTGAHATDVAKHFGITDYVTTISTACSSAANAIMLGARLINNNILDRVVVGGSDALCKFTFNGFNTLMILDKEWCKPFDNNRKGLNLGEGAAYLVLESERVVKAENKKPLAILSGYGNANDAYHQTASSPDGQGAYAAIQKALEVANLSPNKIDYINAHGTGTANNDSSEAAAMQNIFKQNMPPFSSTKAFTGHTLAAAASIEAVITILSIQQKIIFPNLNYTTPMQDTSLFPVTSLQKNIEINHVLSNSFGFGGNCSSLIFSKN
ncbi:MAG TPA: beta-ketoacyl-[acyl-carrier-protein] synthase family protein [Bacteroidia bacterium]|nr:beta-ketoacyl-[acyl-carrier-protein] synthase family protein [Bacteroidia bacterium]